MKNQTMSYSEILNSQFAMKEYVKKTLTPEERCIAIVIKDNKIDNVILGTNCGGNGRTPQFVGLITNVLKTHKVKDSILHINLTDIPKRDHFNFCRRIDDHRMFLLPNHRFTNDDVIKAGPTFDCTVRYLRSKWIPFEKRINAFYTNCIPHPAKRTYFSYALTHPFCKGYIWGGSCHKFFDMPDHLVKELLNKKLAGVKVEPFEEHIKYKYNIYNDGKTLSDRRRLLLNTGAVLVMQTDSPFEEFYTYLLKPGVHYVPFKEVNELEDIFKYLEANPGICKSIIENSTQFVNEYLNYNCIMQYTADLINGLF